MSAWHATPQWVRQGGVCAWDSGWQTPARTEGWAFEGASQALAGSKFAEYFAFPWATLFDLTDRGRLEEAQPLIRALSAAPPRRTLVRATVCQHIGVRRFLHMFSQSGVTDLFWAHAQTDESSIGSLRIHPFPLYPVRCFEPGRSAAGDATPQARPLLYSFVGAFDRQGYRTGVRQWIFDLPAHPRAVVRRRDGWHYEPYVYGRQGQALDAAALDELQVRASEYVRVLAESIFSLCPSGSGPNSIRLWESLGFGSIPVLLADTLALPGDAGEWAEAIIRLPETPQAVASLPARLEALSRKPDVLMRMQKAGRDLWQRFGLHGPATLLGSLACSSGVRSLIDGNERKVLKPGPGIEMSSGSAF